MKWIDRILVVFLAGGVWALLAYYVFLPSPAESQNVYFEVKEAVQDCTIIGRVRQDFYGVHRLQANIDCGPTWVE